MSESGYQGQTIVFANEISFTFSDNECQLKFSVQGQPSIVQAHIGMTHKTAKVLSKILSAILEDFENTTGTEIPFDTTKLDDIKKVLEAKRASDSSAS